MQPEPAQVFYDQPLYSLKPTFADRRIGRSFTFGIATGPIALPASTSARDRAYLAGLSRIDQAEAVRLAAERLTAKANLASRDPFEAKLLFLELNSWRGAIGALLGAPAVQAALSSALDSLTAAQVPPAPPPADPVSELQAQVSTLTARLAALEGLDR